MTLPFKKRKIIQKLENLFGIPFVKLIGENFKKGDSRYYVQKRLLEMIVEKNLIKKAEEIFTHTKDSKTNWNPSTWTYNQYGAVDVSCNPAFGPSVIYHAIKDIIQSGELNVFDFEITNKGRKSNEENESSECRKKPTITVELTCKNCKRVHKNHGLTDPTFLGLRVYECPNCGSFGECSAKITETNKIKFKAVIKRNGIRQEEFVNENLTPIEEEPGLTEKQPSPINTG
ncbi:hypothetical protein M0P65_05505 [Candidatus Gracilibacteria bacterium]|nr:hypothetical protein [Candidatus Gracilibacteria bacterium]